MRWRVRLFCGHVSEREESATSKDLTHSVAGYGLSGERSVCEECGKAPSTIIACKPIKFIRGREARTSKPRPRPAPKPPTLTQRVKDLEAENARLRAMLDGGDQAPSHSYDRGTMSDPEPEPENHLSMEFKVVKPLMGRPLGGDTWMEPRWWDRANWLRYNRATGRWERWGDSVADEGEGG